jgi:hypothetical protein
MEHSYEIFGEKINKGISHFSLGPFGRILDMRELKKLVNFKNLSSISLSGSGLTDTGLSYIVQCERVEHLNLQSTEITNQGLAHLQQLKNLKELRLKENEQLDDTCIPFLNLCQGLVDLQIHETSITEEGLRNLNISGLKQIVIDVWQDNFTYDFLIGYSEKYPECQVIVKGKGDFLNGSFNPGFNCKWGK